MALGICSKVRARDYLPGGREPVSTRERGMNSERLRGLPLQTKPKKTFLRHPRGRSGHKGQEGLSCCSGWRGPNGARQAGLSKPAWATGHPGPQGLVGSQRSYQVPSSRAQLRITAVHSMLPGNGLWIKLSHSI